MYQWDKSFWYIWFAHALLLQTFPLHATNCYDWSVWMECSLRVSRYWRRWTCHPSERRPIHNRDLKYHKWIRFLIHLIVGIEQWNFKDLYLFGFGKSLKISWKLLFLDMIHTRPLRTCSGKLIKSSRIIILSLWTVHLFHYHLWKCMWFNTAINDVHLWPKTSSL